VNPRCSILSSTFAACKVNRVTGRSDSRASGSSTARTWTCASISPGIKMPPARSIVSAVALLIGRSDTSRMSPPSTSTWRSSRRSRLVPSSTAQPVTANAAMKTCLSPPFSADRRLGRIARLAEADYVGSGNPAISS
jgi:hypothetical protein